MFVGAWRSLVAHLYGVQGVPSSNLGAPTKTKKGEVFKTSPFCFDRFPLTVGDDIDNDVFGFCPRFEPDRPIG